MLTGLTTHAVKKHVLCECGAEFTGIGLDDGAAYADGFHQRQQCRDNNHADSDTRKMAQRIAETINRIGASDLPGHPHSTEGRFTGISSSHTQGAGQFGCEVEP